MAENIPLEAITSRALRAVGYHPAKQILAIQFTNGSIFHYAGVPLAPALELYNAESKGRYYASTIRGKFEGEKMTGSCSGCSVQGWIGEPCALCGAGAYLADPFKPKKEKANDGETPESEGPGGQSADANHPER